MVWDSLVSGLRNRIYADLGVNVKYEDISLLSVEVFPVDEQPGGVVLYKEDLSEYWSDLWDDYPEDEVALILTKKQNIDVEVQDISLLVAEALGIEL